MVSSCPLLYLLDLPWVGLCLGAGRGTGTCLISGPVFLVSVKKVGKWSWSGWGVEGYGTVGLVEASPLETHIEKEPEVIPGQGKKREHFL